MKMGNGCTENTIYQQFDTEIVLITASWVFEVTTVVLLTGRELLVVCEFSENFPDY